MYAYFVLVQVAQQTCLLCDTSNMSVVSHIDPTQNGDFVSQGGGAHPHLPNKTSYSTYKIYITLTSGWCRKQGPGLNCFTYYGISHVSWISTAA